MKNDMNI